MNCNKTDCLYFDDQLNKCSIENHDPEDCFLYVTEDDYIKGENYWRKKVGKK